MARRGIELVNAEGRIVLVRPCAPIPEGEWYFWDNFGDLSPNEWLRIERRLCRHGIHIPTSFGALAVDGESYFDRRDRVLNRLIYTGKLWRSHGGTVDSDETVLTHGLPGRHVRVSDVES